MKIMTNFKLAFIFLVTGFTLNLEDAEELWLMDT